MKKPHWLLLLEMAMPVTMIVGLVVMMLGTVGCGRDSNQESANTSKDKLTGQVIGFKNESTSRPIVKSQTNGNVIDGLFGVVLGSKYEGSLGDCKVLIDGVMMSYFTPEKQFRGFKEYECYFGPRSRMISRIVAIEEYSEDEIPSFETEDNFGKKEWRAVVGCVAAKFGLKPNYVRTKSAMYQAEFHDPPCHILIYLNGDIVGGKYVYQVTINAYNATLDEMVKREGALSTLPQSDIDAL